MDNRRLIISIVICIALMLGWQAFAQHMGWLPEPTQQAEQIQPVEQAQPEVMAAAPAAPVVPGFVPEDIDTPVAAARQQPVKPQDVSDIDEIFSIFRR